MNPELLKEMSEKQIEKTIDFFKKKYKFEDVESFYLFRKKKGHLKDIDIFILKYKQWWKLNKKIKFDRITYDIKETKSCDSLLYSHKSSAESIIMRNILKNMDIPFFK